EVVVHQHKIWIPALEEALLVDALERERGAHIASPMFQQTAHGLKDGFLIVHAEDFEIERAKDRLGCRRRRCILGAQIAGRGQVEREARALAFRAVELKREPERRDKALDDGEAQTQALGHARAAIEPGKFGKEQLVLVAVKADAGIDNVDADAIAAPPDTNQYLSASGGIYERG